MRKRCTRALIAALAFGSLSISAVPAFASTVVPIANFDDNFGSVSEVVNGSFDYDFTFVVPLSGIAGSSLTSVKVQSLPGLVFTSLTFNGTALQQTMFGNVQQFARDNVPVLAGTQHFGVVGSGHGGFGADVSYSPGGVPEPASWALMILGFGGLGAVLRRKRAATTVFA
jgi:hypothetical protein